MYENELNRLRSQLSFVSDVNVRLTNELNQIHVSNPGILNTIDGADSGAGQLDTLPDWMVSESLLSPLLTCYDSRLNEMRSTISKQRRALESFGDNCEQLVAENELLRENQIKDLNVFADAGESDAFYNASGAGGASGAGTKTGVGGGSGSNHIVSDLEERLNILMNENSLMAEQGAVLSKELESSQVHIMECESNVVNLTDSLSKAGKAMCILEDDNEALKQERVTAEKNVISCNERIVTLEDELRKAKVSVREISGLRSDLRLKLDEVNEERNVMENENNELSKSVKFLSDRYDSLKNKYAEKNKECDNASQTLRATVAELNTIRNDAEGMVNVMDGMERQLSEFQAREDGISTLSKDCQQRVEEAILERDQANVKYATLRKEVAKLLEERKRFVEERGKENENVVAVVKEQNSGLVESKDREIHDLVIANAKLKSEAERCRREKARAEEMYNKVRNLLDGERDGLRDSFGDVKRRITEAEARAEMELTTNKNSAAVIKQLQGELEAKELANVALLAKLEKDTRRLQSEYDGAAKELRDARDVLEQKAFEAKRMLVMLEEAKSSTGHRLAETVAKLEMDLEEAKIQVESTRMYGRERESYMQEQVENATKLVERTRRDKDVMLEELEKKLGEEREVGSRMTTRNQELGVRVNLLAAEKAELNIIAAEADGKYEEAESLLNESEARAQELMLQLNAHVTDQEKRIQTEGQLKAEINKLMNEVQRLKR
jgi:myosin protein heavy chain